MADATTANRGYTKPTVGADSGTWGGTINGDLDAIDADMQMALSGAASASSAAAAAQSKANAALPASGGSASGLDITPAATPDVNAAGYLGSPINGQNGNYTFQMSDIGKTVFHNSTAGHVWTLPDNGAVNWPVGAIIGLLNYNAGGAVSISPASDVTLVEVPGGGYGARSLASTGMASLQNVGANTWMIAGAGVS